MADTSLVFNLVAKDKASETVGQLQEKFGAAGLSAGAALAVGLSTAMDMSEANTRLANQLGLTKTEAKQAGDISGRVFSAGFGDSIGTVNDALGAVAQNLGGFSQLGSSKLTELTQSALGLATTFDFDLNQATQAAGTLMKAGLAKDGTEAFDLLTAAAQKLPPAMREELPELTTEYSEFFNQLGFTGPQMMGLLTQAAKDPTFQLDKLGDAVKEFTLRLGDTAAVKAPLQQLKLDVGHIQKLVNTGHGTKAFDEVTAALKHVDDQTKRTQLQAALFGGPGEDMGNSLLKLSATGAAAASGMDKAAGSSKKITDSMKASAGQSMNSIMRSLSVTLGNMLAPALNKVATLMKEHPGLIKVVVPVVLGLAAALGIAAAAVWAMNSAMLANPIFWISAAIAALVAIIVVIATKTQFFQTIWNTVWGGIKTATSAAVSGIQTALNWFAGLGPLFSGWWNSAKTAAVAKMTSLVTWATGLPGRISTALSSLPGTLKTTATRAWSSFKSTSSTAASNFITWVRGIPGRISRGLGSLAGLLVGAGKDVVRGLWNGIKSMGSWLKSTLIGWARNLIPGPIAKALGIASPSKVMAKQVGRWIPAGIQLGIQQGNPALQQTMATLIQPGQTGAAAPLTGGMGARLGAATGGGVVVVRFEMAGADGEFKKLIRKITKVDGRGSVQVAFGT